MSDQKTPLMAVTLLKRHRHAGRDYKPEQTIRLAQHKAEWLISQQIAKAAEPEAAPAAKPSKKEPA